MDRQTAVFMEIVAGICLFLGAMMGIATVNMSAFIGWALALMWFAIAMGHKYK